MEFTTSEKNAISKSLDAMMLVDGPANEKEIECFNSFSEYGIDSRTLTEGRKTTWPEVDQILHNMSDENKTFFLKMMFNIAFADGDLNEEEKGTIGGVSLLIGNHILESIFNKDN